MPKIYEVYPKKLLSIIYVIDTSGSMTGARIAAVNEAMHECVEILKEKACEIPDAEIRIGALKFSSGAQWVTKSGFVSIEDFYWNDMQASGVTDLGAALKELDMNLSRKSLPISEMGYYRLPVIIFMSDGSPTDEWMKALENTNKNNKWFRKARKIAVAIGDDANKDVLQELVGTREAVVQANDLDTLKSLIVAISVSSVTFGSDSWLCDPEDGSAILNLCDPEDRSAILKDALNNVEGEVKVEKDINIPVTLNTDTDSDADGGDDWGDNDWKQKVIQSCAEDMIMSNVEGIRIIPKKLLPVIYVVDTSGGMADNGIATVNEAMHECEEILKEKASEIPDAEIKIGALKFSSDAQWVTGGGLVPLEEFFWEDLQTDGTANLGVALRELDSKLNRKAFLVSETDYCTPVIIFMSDGQFTEDWRKALEDTNKNNKWFRRAIKIAVAISDSADTDVLQELVGNSEAVIRWTDMETLMFCIRSYDWIEDDNPCIDIDIERVNQDIKTDINSADDWNDIEWD